jgi:hypothetical protein
MDNIMITKNYEYNGYFIEIHEHPIYHDFEYVIKTLDNKEVKATSTDLYNCEYDAEISAQLNINNILI